MAVRTVRNGTIVITDGAAGTCTATFDGEVSWTTSKNAITMLDRGVIGHFRPGNQACCEVSFNILCEGMTGGTTVYDAVTRTGGAVAWTSISAATSDVYTVKITVTYTDPTTGADNEKITFAACALTRVEFSEAEDGNRMSFTLLDLEESPTIAAV